MKRTGDYTVIFPKMQGEAADSCHRVTSVEWEKIRNGSQGDTPLFTFELRTKSAHGDYYNGRFHTRSFSLKNNSTGKITKHTA